MNYKSHVRHINGYVFNCISPCLANKIRMLCNNPFDVLLSFFPFIICYFFLLEEALSLPLPQIITIILSFHALTFFLAGFFPAANLQSSSVHNLASCFSDNLSVGFVLLLELIEIIWLALAIWMSHMHSCELLDSTLQPPPYWAVPLYIEAGIDCLLWGQSHQKLLPLSAMWRPAASACCWASITQWLMDGVSYMGRSEGLNRTCVQRPVSVCRNVDVSLQSVKVTAVERGSWGRTDPARWLLGEMGNQLSGLVLWFQSE